MKKNQESKYFAHGGDVQVVSTTLPSTAKKIEHTPLAYGEKSGHIHVATGDVTMFQDGNDYYLAVGSDGAMLQHVHQSNFNNDYSTKNVISKADHNVTPLKPNTTYKVGIHKRYNPFQKVWDKARD